MSLRKHSSMSDCTDLQKMRSENSRLRLCLPLMVLIWAVAPSQAAAQNRLNEEDEQFGPVVRAYLGYLRNEQEVVDDRVSRREISRAYYRRNSNRIRALRQIAIRIARESGNDYLPELEAVAANEMSTLFEHPPKPGALQVGAILSSTFRFLGSVRSGEIFYVFARLDPYEQVESTGKDRAVDGQPPRAGAPKRSGPITRARRVITP